MQKLVVSSKKTKQNYGSGGGR